MRLLKSVLHSNLFRNGIWGVGGSGVGRILNLVAMVLLARQLGLVQFGYFGLVQATLGMFGVLAGASIGSTATRFIAQYRNQDPARASRILGMVQLLSLGLAGGVMMLVAGLSGWIASLLETGDGTDLQGPVIAGGVLMAVNSMRSVQDSTLGGFEAFRDIALLKLAEGLGILLFMPWMAMSYGVAGALAGMALATGIVLAGGAVLVLRRLRHAEIRIDWRGIRHESRILSSYSLPSLMTHFLGTPVLWFGIWWLSRQPEGVAGSALYNAAYQWHGPLIFVPMVLSTVGMPMLVRLWTGSDRRGFLKLFGVLALAAIALTGLPALVVVFLKESVMLGYGAEFLAGQTALILLVAAAPAHSLANIGLAALQSMNRAWLGLSTIVLWAAAFLSLAWLLVPALGAAGLAAAFLSAYSVLALSRIVLVFTLR